MSQYGQAYQPQMYSQSSQRNDQTQHGSYAHAPQQMQQQSMPPRGGGGGGGGGGGAYQQPYKGTLAPGTKVKVGNITVTVKRYLSEGGFAHVYLVTTSQPIPMPSSVTGAIGASMAASATAGRGETVHVLKRMAVPDKAALADVRREVEVHKLLRNQANIVHFIEASATALQGGGYEIFILMEYCSGGGIISLMNARLRDRLREEEVLKIFGDVCAGVAVMHHLDPPLMHRDLKVENILMAPSTDPGTIPGSRSTSSNLKATFKLCDFGSAAPVLSRKPAKSMDEVKRVEADLNKHTTLQYRAPEMVDVYQRRVIDEKADIWALGVLLYKLCYYTTPFEENGGGPLAILNVQYRIPPQPVYSEKLKQLIHSMLKEQSTDRPTIDQVIINVHQILGTRPSQAALHYASAAASGKIAAPLPTLVSNAKASANADLAASLRQPKPAAGGIDANLISMGPSKKELEQAEARELELHKQSITPMRRGRPTKANAEASSPTKKVEEDIVVKSSSPAPEPRAKSSPQWSVPNSSKPSSSGVKTGPLIEGFGDSFSPSAPATSSSTESPPSFPKRPAPPSVSPNASGDATSKPSDRAVDKNLLHASSNSDAPSPALSPLRHSPALPGFSVASSPAPSPLPPGATAGTGIGKGASRPPSGGASTRDELTDRFPSLEDLDAQYAMPAAPSSSAPSSAPLSLASGGNQVNVPGLANRASVGAMAGRFERPFEPQRPGTPASRVALSKSATISAFSSTNESGAVRKGRTGSVSKRWQPSAMAHDRMGKEPESRPSAANKSPASKDWLTGDVSDDEPPASEKKEKEKETKILASQLKSPSSPLSTAVSRGKEVDAGKEIEVEEPSSDEDEPAEPEKAVAQRPGLPPRLSADRLSSFNRRPAGDQPQNDTEANGKSSSKPERPRITPGRVKAPSWLVDAVDSPTAAERLITSTSITSQPEKSAACELVSPITDATAAEQLDEAARKAQDQLEELLRGPADETPATNGVGEQGKGEEKGEECSSVTSVAKMKAPAWDDDDEDMQEERSALSKPEIMAKPVTLSKSGGKPESQSESQTALLTHKPLQSSSGIAGRWHPESSTSAPAPEKKEKQLVEVATSPVSVASPTSTSPQTSVDTVKDGFSSFSLTSPTTKQAQQPQEPKPIRASTLVSYRACHSSTISDRPSQSEPTIIQALKRPTPIRPNKSADLRSAGLSKPWEREAALRAAATRGSIVKNSALPAASTARLHTADEDQGDIDGVREGQEDERVEGNRYNGVSSLISRWQQSVESNAPGWGLVGSSSRDGDRRG
ncbi:related to ARK1 - Actin Regulating Kinase [Ustilago sp. UG-2017b]|nr:related to ARK1 - Actin Regulating Kinase [Ustilago sp. UG-2017b]